MHRISAFRVSLCSNPTLVMLTKWSKVIAIGVLTYYLAYITLVLVALVQLTHLNFNTLIWPQAQAVLKLSLWFRQLFSPFWVDNYKLRQAWCACHKAFFAMLLLDVIIICFCFLALLAHILWFKSVFLITILLIGRAKTKPLSCTIPNNDRRQSLKKLTQDYWDEVSK